MISTIIFDMDGVIIDSELIHQQLEDEMFAEQNLIITEEDHKDFVGTSSIDMWTKIGKKQKLSKSPQELLILGREMYWKALEKDKVLLFEGALDLIKLFYYNNFIIHVASSATHQTVDKVLEYFNIGKYFKYRIGGDEVLNSKPDPEIFIKSAMQSDSISENCLVIEDSGHGVAAAKAAGMICVGFDNPAGVSQNLSQADQVVKKLSEIDIQLINSL